MLPLPLVDLSDDEDAQPRQLAPRVYRRRSVLANFMDGEVKENFRLTRATIAMLEDRLEPTLTSKYQRRNDLSVGDQLAIALKYYASGDHYKTIAEARGVTEKTVSVTVDKVTDALLHIAPEIIKLPSTQQDINSAKEGFYEIAQMPRIVGIVDGTHLEVVRPFHEPDGPFICRVGVR